MKKIRIQALTEKQHELLCECVRYRCADNHKEMADAQRDNKPTKWYEDKDNELQQLKQLIGY